MEGTVKAIERARGLRPQEIPEWLWATLVNTGLGLALGSRQAEPLNGAGDVGDGADGNLAAALRGLVARVKANYGSADGGVVDYAKLRDSADMEQIQECAARLRGFDPRKLRNHYEQMAFWINLYNALTVHAIIAFAVEGSVLRQRGFFRKARYAVGEFVLSLDEIEHGILRGNRAPPIIPARIFAPGDPRRQLTIAEPDPRVHFALNCGSRSCPPIAAYDADRLDDQLEMATRSFLEGGGMEVDSATGEMTLSKLLKWYGGDFGGRSGVLAFLKRYADSSEAEVLDELQIRWLDYDWSLNKKG